MNGERRFLELRNRRIERQRREKSFSTAETVSRKYIKRNIVNQKGFIDKIKIDNNVVWNRTNSRILRINPNTNENLLLNITKDIQKLNFEEFIGENSKLFTLLNDQNSESKLDDLKTTMAFSVDLGIKFIPEYDGSPQELDRFFLNADLLYKTLTDNKEKKLFVEFAKCRLRGKAFNFIKYKNIENWDEFKKELRGQFSEAKSVEQLQVELVQIRQFRNEDVKIYGNRVEQTLSQLNDACILREGTDSSELIQKMNSNTALKAFQDGLKDPIKIIIKACRFTSLRESITKAIEEELSLNNNKMINPFHNYNEQNKIIKCQICQRFGHIATNCVSFRNQNRSQFHNTSNYNNNSNIFRPSFNSTSNFNQNQKPNQSNYRNFSQNLNKSEQKPNLSSTTYFNRSVNQMFINCGYCRKNGHHIRDCNKRKYVENKRSSEQNYEPASAEIHKEEQSTSHSENSRTLDLNKNATFRVKDL